VKRKKKTKTGKRSTTSFKTLRFGKYKIGSLKKGRGEDVEERDPGNGKKTSRERGVVKEPKRDWKMSKTCQGGEHDLGGDIKKAEGGTLTITIGRRQF